MSSIKNNKWNIECEIHVEHPTIKDLNTAIEIYYKYPEIGCKEVEELFGVTQGYASTVKGKIKKKMDEHNLKSYCHNTVDTEFAFFCWGIDITDLERRLAKLKKL